MQPSIFKAEFKENYYSQELSFGFELQEGEIKRKALERIKEINQIFKSANCLIERNYVVILAFFYSIEEAQ